LEGGSGDEVEQLDLDDEDEGPINEQDAYKNAPRRRRLRKDPK
jgi:hypothetical protein